MSKEEFIQITSDYKGTISEEDNSIIFSNVNALEDERNWDDGFYMKVRHIRCEIGLNLVTSHLFGCEDTHSIIGGFYGDTPSKETLIHNLERYGFTKKDVEVPKPKHKKEWEQMTLFDFI